MVQQRGRERDFVKLLDFGIAKLTGDQSGSQRTRTGIVMGTPSYMSPEQCEGRGNIDHRTDVYALGIVLYEMLTGRVPFLGEGYGEILVQHLTQPPVSPSTFRVIPPHVEAIVLKALAKSPAHRFPSMDEFMRAMVDPVTYVEERGGIIGFSERIIEPVAAGTPLPALVPVAALTPLPGMMTAGMAAPSPASAALTGVAATSVPPKNRTKVIVITAAAVTAIGVAAVLALGGGSKKPTAGAVTPADAPLLAVVVDAPPPITSDAGKATTVVPPDAPAVRKLKVTINPTPADAEVTIDGVARNSVELSPVPPAVKIVVKAKGYVTKETTLQTSDLPDVYALPIDLDKKRGGGTRPNPGSSGKPGGDNTIKPGDI
jgi:eukaryotic-like serine/threonine-protein kinase